MENLYQGREQTAAKHEILQRYLESFAHKVARTYGTIDYVDAFCGPWEERDSTDLTDTSISIALKKLQAVAETLDNAAQKPIRCIFNEKTSASYKKLKTFVEGSRELYPLLDIHTLCGTFEANAAEIKGLSTNNFMLLFVDPTGWSGFSPDALRVLTGQRNSEIIINFMRTHIERFLCPPGPDQADRLEALLGKQRSEKFVGRYVNIKEIEAELVQVLKSDLGFRFAASSPIHNPDKDQIHFQLFYATHHPAGMEVMRHAEFEALSLHDRTRFKKKRDPNQGDLFGSDFKVEGPYLQTRREHLACLPADILGRLEHSSHNLKFSNLRAQMQETHYLREAEIKDAIVALADAGKIEPTWKVRGGRRPKTEDKIHLIVKGR